MFSNLDFVGNIVGTLFYELSLGRSVDSRLGDAARGCVFGGRGALVIDYRK